jgi:hypothetical protein
MEHKAVCHTTSEKEASVRIYEQVFGWYAGFDSFATELFDEPWRSRGRKGK